MTDAEMVAKLEEMIRDRGFYSLVRGLILVCDKVHARFKTCPESIAKSVHWKRAAAHLRGFYSKLEV